MASEVLCLSSQSLQKFSRRRREQGTKGRSINENNFTHIKVLGIKIKRKFERKQSRGLRNEDPTKNKFGNFQCRANCLIQESVLLLGKGCAAEEKSSGIRRRRAQDDNNWRDSLILGGKEDKRGDIGKTEKGRKT